jgi:hypothetical protein
METENNKACIKRKYIPQLTTESKIKFEIPISFSTPTPDFIPEKFELNPKKEDINLLSLKKDSFKNNKEMKPLQLIEKNQRDIFTIPKKRSTSARSN